MARCGPSGAPHTKGTDQAALPEVGGRGLITAARWRMREHPAQLEPPGRPGHRGRRSGGKAGSDVWAGCGGAVREMTPAIAPAQMSLNAPTHAPCMVASTPVSQMAKTVKKIRQGTSDGIPRMLSGPYLPPHVRARKMFVFVMIEAIMLGELLRAEASATSIRFRNAGAANRCCCDPRSTTESAEKAPATLRLISSGSVYAITARPMMPLLRTRAEGASERTEARSGSGVRRGAACRALAAWILARKRGRRLLRGRFIQRTTRNPVYRFF